MCPYVCVLCHVCPRASCLVPVSSCISVSSPPMCPRASLPCPCVLVCLCVSSLMCPLLCAPARPTLSLYHRVSACPPLVSSPPLCPPYVSSPFRVSQHPASPNDASGPPAARLVTCGSFPAAFPSEGGGEAAEIWEAGAHIPFPVRRVLE